MNRRLDRAGMMIPARSLRAAAVGLLAATALGITGCSGSAGPTDDASVVTEPPAEIVDVEPTDTDAARTTPWRVALVAPSAQDDSSWTQAMSASLQRVAAGRPIELFVSGGLFVVDDAAAAIRRYAEDGFDLVIVHGTQYARSLAEISLEYPDVSFATGTATEFGGRPNVFLYAAAAGHGGYVNGVIAAQLTESDVIGVVAPVPAGDAQSYVDGFVLGVASENGAAEVAVDFIDSFTDVQLAAESARALVARGADVLTGTSQMVPGAIGVAENEGAPWLGNQWDQSALGPGTVVAAQVYDWTDVIDAMLDRIATGTPGGEAFVISFASGGVEMQYNDAFDLDPAIRASADAAVAGIIDGSIVVPAAG